MPRKSPGSAKYAQILLVAIALAMQLAAAALAVQPDEVLPDPQLEARARGLSRELRCMVCQNQSIDDSEAPLARDLRLLVRERLKVGDSDAQVLDFLTTRYGEFVLLKPRLAWHNALLWLAPPAVLTIGIMALVVARRGRRGAARPGGAEEPPLTASEQARLAQLLEAEAKHPARNSPR